MRTGRHTEAHVPVTILTRDGEACAALARWTATVSPEVYETATLEERLRSLAYMDFERVLPGTVLDRLARENAVADCRIRNEDREISFPCVFWHHGEGRVRAIRADQR